MIGSKVRLLSMELMLEALWLDFLENPCQVTLIKDFPGITSSTITLPSRSKLSTLTVPLYQALVLWMLGYAEEPEADFIPGSSTLEGVYRKEKRSRDLQPVSDHLLLGSRIVMHVQEQKVKNNEGSHYERKLHERLRESYSQFLNRRIRKIMDINYLNDNNVKRVNVMTEERVLVQLISEIYQAWHQHFLKVPSITEIDESNDN